MDVAPAGDPRPGSDGPRGGVHQPLPGAAARRAGQGGGGHRGCEDGLRQPRTGEWKSERPAICEVIALAGGRTLYLLHTVQ